MSDRPREIVYGKVEGVRLEDYLADMIDEMQEPFGWQERAAEAFAQRPEVAYFERAWDRAAMAVNARCDLVCIDPDGARAVAKMHGVPDAALGIPTPWWRRIMQRFTRRARQRARRR